MSTYIKVLLLSVGLPFLLSFWPPLKLWRNTRSMFLTLVLIVFIFGSWDVFAVWRGHWSFNLNDVWPMRIINLPLEEVLFFILIPFACIFTWEAVCFLAKSARKR